MLFYVKYKVLGAIHKAGPYARVLAESHRDDIQGYEGVTNVEIIPETEPKSAWDRLLESTE
jgi:hypothetical protein